MTESEAIQATSHLEAEIRRIDRIEAKQTTWWEYEAAVAQVLGAQSLFGPAPMSRVVIVAVSGEIVPAFRVVPLVLGWATVAWDANTREPLGLSAGHGDWPPFFDSLAAVTD